MSGALWAFGLISGRKFRAAEKRESNMEGSKIEAKTHQKAAEKNSESESEVLAIKSRLNRAKRFVTRERWD